MDNPNKFVIPNGFDSTFEHTSNRPSGFDSGAPAEIAGLEFDPDSMPTTALPSALPPFSMYEFNHVA